MSSYAPDSPEFHARRLGRFLTLALEAAQHGNPAGKHLAEWAARDAYWTLHDLGAGDEAKAILAAKCGLTA